MTDRNRITSSSKRTVKKIRRRVYTWAMNLESAPIFGCRGLIKGMNGLCVLLVDILCFYFVIVTCGQSNLLYQHNLRIMVPNSIEL